MGKDSNGNWLQGHTWDNTTTFSAAGTKIGDLQRAVYDLLTGPKHEGGDALPTSIRFLFYELVQMNVIPKKYPDKADGTPNPRTPDQDVSLALTHLRQVKLVPWTWIKDESRRLIEWSYSTSMYSPTCLSGQRSAASISGMVRRRP